MHLIIGLGNPGKKYYENRHNAGQLALNEIILEYKLNKITSKLPATIYKGEIANQKVLAMHPKTYMNECGSACKAVADFYKIDSHNIVVLQDDLDMALGKVRIKIVGGNGGHNGIKSIDSFIKQDYVKIKIGIGHPDKSKQAVDSYVLSDFTADEMPIIQRAFKNIVQYFECIVEGQLEKFGSIINNAGNTNGI